MRKESKKFYIYQNGECIHTTFSLVFAIDYCKLKRIRIGKIKCSDGREWFNIPELIWYYNAIAEEIDYLMSF